MRCPECGHPIDLTNESQPACPACGADPFAGARVSDLGLDEYGGVGMNEPEISFDDLPEEVKAKS
jgi:hypothetical protein